MSATPYNAEDIRKLRDIAEVGIDDAKRAFELLHDPEHGHLFGGDILHALCTVEANKLAIRVHGNREAWNVRHGASRAASLRQHVPAVAAAYPVPENAESAPKP